MEPARVGETVTLALRLRRVAPDMLVGFAALAAVAALFPGVVLGREHLWGDFATWYYPSHAFAAARMRAAAWPLWNPYNDCGMPFAGEADHGSFYPPSWLLHALTGDGTALFRGLEVFTLLHVALAILTLYGLLRTLGCSRVPALVGGLTYGLGGEFFARSGHVALVCAQAWVPVALGGTFHALRRRDARCALAAAFALGLIGLSGSPATLVVSVAALPMLIGATVLSGRQEPLWREALRGLAVLSVVLALGGLLAAVQLLPMWEFVQLSERSTYSYDEVAQYSLTPASLIMQLVPRFFGWLKYDQLGYWGPNNFAELSAYVGLLPLALATLALRLRPRGETLPWIALAATTFWIALGKGAGLHWLMYRYVPVLGEMRAPARYLLVWALGVAVLAGLGLDSVLRSSGALEWQRWRAVLASAASSLAALFALLAEAAGFFLPEWQQPFFSSGLSRSAISAAGAALGLLLLGRLRAPLAGAIVALLVANDLSLQGRGVGVVPAGRADELLDASAGPLRVPSADPALFRISNRYANPGQLMAQKLQSDFGPGRHVLAYAEYDARIASHESAMFELLSIKYLVDVRHPAIRSPWPNLIAQHEVWQKEQEVFTLPVDPPRESASLEVVATTVLTGPQPEGQTVGEIEVVGTTGETRLLPLRLGMELADVALRGPVTSAQPISTPYFVDVTDAGTQARQYYLTTLRFAQLSVTALRLHHHGGPSQLGIKGLYLQPSRAEPADGWHQVWLEPGTDDVVWRVFENSNVLPRAILVPRARTAASRERALAWVAAEDFDPRHELIVERSVPEGSVPEGSVPEGSVPEGSVPEGSVPEGSVPEGSVPDAARLTSPPVEAVTVRRYEPERIELTANAPAGGSWLFLSEVFYPGWNARIDDRPAPILRANGLFRAVWLEGGQRSVTFRYEPRSFVQGAYLSLSGLCALVVASGWVAWRRRRRDLSDQAQG